eukprot:m.80593 g.80593  ORF g.80593 m.80593 type:complete len:202 (+) comp12767_c0_seq12:220-825(+)
MVDAHKRISSIAAHLSGKDDSDAVLFEVCSKGIATITINRPGQRNSMTHDVMSRFSQRINEVMQNPDIRCVIIAGKGSCFSAGASFGSHLGREDNSFSSPWENSMKNVYGPFLEVLNIKVPVIAAMNGHAIGGGLGLALVADIRIAEANSKYGATFVKLGLHPGMASTYLLPRIMGLPKVKSVLWCEEVLSTSISRPQSYC